MNSWIRILVIAVTLFFFFHCYKTKIILSQDNYYPIALNQVALYSEPNVKSKVIVKLNYIDYVKIIKISNIKIHVNDHETTWVYVKTTRANENCVSECEGWLLDYYIAFPDKFKKVMSWNIKEFKGCAGDFCPSYKFYPNGSFVMRLGMCLGGDCDENKKRDICLKSAGKYLGNSVCEYKGHLYRHLNLIKAIKVGSNSFNYLFLTDSGFLCLPDSSDPCMK